MWMLIDTHGAPTEVTLDRDTTIRLEGKIDESYA